MEQSLKAKIDRIRAQNKSIYTFDEECYLETHELEFLLSFTLVGRSYKGLPLRTRSKVVKTDICESLGYLVPHSFLKTNPRFPSQDFDVYIQKSLNLQIWNEDISMTRRYVLVRLNSDDVVTRVRVITGGELVEYDTTGKITIKHQAKFRLFSKDCALLTKRDTILLSEFLCNDSDTVLKAKPNEHPKKGDILPIQNVFDRLAPLIGVKFIDSGIDQERNRGGTLHRLICKQLGYSVTVENGQFPDILNQLLEVKMQTSPTIDLGLICPNSASPLSIKINQKNISPRDVRYAMFYGSIAENMVTLQNLYIVNGEQFFDFFPQMEGKVVNKKIQIPLPVVLFR